MNCGRFGTNLGTGLGIRTLTLEFWRLCDSTYAIRYVPVFKEDRPSTEQKGGNHVTFEEFRAGIEPISLLARSALSTNAITKFLVP